MKTAAYVLVALGAVPLLAYPIILLMGVFILFGKRTGNEPVLQELAAHAFILAALAYLPVYVASAVGVFAAGARRADQIALGVAAVPPAFLLVITGLAAVWAAVG